MSRPSGCFGRKENPFLGDFGKIPDQALDTVASEIPAADRFVTIDHNSKSYIETEKYIDELVNTVQRANDLEISAEERAAVIEEIGAIKRAIAGTYIFAFCTYRTRLPAGDL